MPYWTLYKIGNRSRGKIRYCWNLLFSMFLLTTQFFKRQWDQLITDFFRFRLRCWIAKILVSVLLVVRPLLRYFAKKVCMSLLKSFRSQCCGNLCIEQWNNWGDIDLINGWIGSCPKYSDETSSRAWNLKPLCGKYQIEQSFIVYLFTRWKTAVLDEKIFDTRNS